MNRSDSPNDLTIETGFGTLKLYPDAAMHIQLQVDSAKTRHEVRFIGYIRDKSLLLSLPFQDGKGLWMQSGQTFIARGFNGRYAYAFTTQVIRARAHPFPYVHFSWPRKIECQLVRKSLRIAVSLPGNVSIPGNSPIAVTLLDLSASGAMLDSPAGLGATGDRIQLGFVVDFEGSAVNLNLDAIIRNVGEKGDASGFRIGVGFEKVAQNEVLILHYFINSINQEANK